MKGQQKREVCGGWNRSYESARYSRKKSTSAATISEFRCQQHLGEHVFSDHIANVDLQYLNKKGPSAFSDHVIQNEPSGMTKTSPKQSQGTNQSINLDISLNWMYIAFAEFIILRGKFCTMSLWQLVPKKLFNKPTFLFHIFWNSYIHLVPESSVTSSAVCTLLLCSPDETSLEELKTVCQASVSALHETLGSPYVVPGAGCLDTHLASFLRQHGKSNCSKIVADLGCTRGKHLVWHWYIALCALAVTLKVFNSTPLS